MQAKLVYWACKLADLLACGAPSFVFINIVKKKDEKYCVFVVLSHLLNSLFDQVGACLVVKWCEKVACLNMKINLLVQTTGGRFSRAP